MRVHERAHAEIRRDMWNESPMTEEERAAMIRMQEKKKKEMEEKEAKKAAAKEEREAKRAAKAAAKAEKEAAKSAKKAEKEAATSAKKAEMEAEQTSTTTSKKKKAGGWRCCATPKAALEEEQAEEANGGADIVISSTVKKPEAGDVHGDDDGGTKGVSSGKLADSPGVVSAAQGTEPEHSSSDIHRLNQQLQSTMLDEETASGNATPAAEAKAAAAVAEDTSSSSFSTLDRLFSVRSSNVSSVANEEAHEISKLQKSSRHSMLIIGALMFQAGIIYIGIALVRTLGSLYRNLKMSTWNGTSSRGMVSLLAHIIVEYGMDVVGECLMGYVFVAFSNAFANVAVLPGRDVTSLATVELAAVFHRFRFILLFVCIWTVYDLFVLPAFDAGLLRLPSLFA